MPISIVLVDDQALVRAGFRALLGSDPELEVVGEASDGVEALKLTSSIHPDVVLMDVRMPGMDGLEATRRILSQETSTKVIILTTFDLDEYVYAGLQAGASGFVLKDIEPADLLRAVKVVAKGEALLAPSVTRRLISEFAARRPAALSVSLKLVGELTEREREILALVGRGLSNDGIAEQLVISTATVRTHLSRIMSKLDAHDRAQLVIVAYESGLVSDSKFG